MVCRMLDFLVTNISGAGISFSTGVRSIKDTEQVLISTESTPVRDVLSLRRRGLISIDEILGTVGGVATQKYYEKPDVLVRNDLGSSIHFNLENIGGTLTLLKDETSVISTYEVSIDDLNILSKDGLIALLGYPHSVGGVPLPPITEALGSTKNILRVGGFVPAETEVHLPAGMFYTQSKTSQASASSGIFLDVYYNGILLQADSTPDYLLNNSIIEDA